ncbi:MAG: hypothetical protein KGM43_13315 [Planctomycetota bacterium]|nr:hypothetical protein [Planctomycetota bacterium]
MWTQTMLTRDDRRAWLWANLVMLGSLILGAAVLVALQGCGVSSKAGTVDPDLAREALRTVLDTWKRGEAPASLKSQSPAITVQDFDWQGGRTLIDYELLGDDRAVEANLYCGVVLKLKGKTGKVEKKRVRYIVGTSPITTVFREFFQ